MKHIDVPRVKSDIYFRQWNTNACNGRKNENNHGITSSWKYFFDHVCVLFYTIYDMARSCSRHFTIWYISMAITVSSQSEKLHVLCLYSLHTSRHPVMIIGRWHELICNTSYIPSTTIPAYVRDVNFVFHVPEDYRTPKSLSPSSRIPSVNVLRWLRLQCFSTIWSG